MTFRNVKWLQLDVNCFAAVNEIENDSNLKIILNFKGCICHSYFTLPNAHDFLYFLHCFYNIIAVSFVDLE